MRFPSAIVWRKPLIRALAFSAIVPVLLFVVLYIAYPLRIEKLTPHASLWVTDCKNRLLRVYVSSQGEYQLPCKLGEVSPYIVSSTLCFEDRWFFWHPGLNPVSTLRALWINLRAGKVLTGGSTITQQVARLMEPRSRTVTSKVIEAFRAFQLELRFSKREILEAYFNLATYGGNIRGVVAASHSYFGKSPRELGPGEAALLAVLPNSPTQLRPDRHREAAEARRNELLRRMLDNGAITQEMYRLALMERVPEARQPFPIHAPHFCDRLYSKYGDTGGRIAGTVDLDLQTQTEDLLRRHLSPLIDQNISNGAVVIIENASGAVRALVGSAAYFDERIDGQVDGTFSPRSPGSTLKPFAYGIALDAGRISPLSLLYDVPHDYSGYRPLNYDESYSGMVTVTHALTHSLNVPAVRLVSDIGYGKFYDLLKSGGITTLDQSCEYYGLTLVLGGAGINLLELTDLYSALANQGKYRPYRILESDPVRRGDSLLSSAACYILTDILSQLQRPDFPSAWDATLHLPRIAWKTGTSHGRRDAWSVGYNPRYSVGVWLGNFSGVGSRALVGADAATPLLFDLMSALESEGGSWFEMPDEVCERQVCAVSGMIPGPDCPSTRKELCLRGRSPRLPCSMHVTYAIDNRSGYRLCSQCRVGRSHHLKTFVQFPAELATWVSENGRSPESIPKHNPECRQSCAGTGPVINSPADDCQYVLRRGVPLRDQQIRLEASVPSGIETIFWFVDGELLYKGNPGKPIYYSPMVGRHEVVCMDDEGRQSQRILVII